MNPKGKALIFSAPSGAGKTTLVRHLLGVEKLRLRFSISATTREPRGNETPGEDYHFLSHTDFVSRMDRQEFVEWEEVYEGQYYGTLKSEIERIWNDGDNAIFDVDVVGGLELKKAFGDQALAIFISPPDLHTLNERLGARGTETEEKITQRMNKAKFEMAFADRFDVIIKNDELKTALKEAENAVAEFIGE